VKIIRRAALLPAFVIASVAAACGSAKNADVPRVLETEPNDTVAQANVITRNWSTIHLGGTCSSATDVDWFKVTFATYVSPAPMAATLGWTGAGMLSLSLYDSFGTTLLSTDASASSPNVVTMTLTTSGVFYLEVQCGGTIAATDSWTLDIPAPGANPGEE